MATIRFGIDLGGTKIEAVALDPQGAEIARERTPTPGESYEANLAAIGDLLAKTEQRAGAPAVKVGIGTPGSLSPETGQMRNADSTRLNGRTLDRDLERVLNRPVRLENDANCFALAEATAGAGQNARTVLGLILGTGVGSGIVVDGRTLVGHNRIGGEWGHNPLPIPGPEERPGPKCSCGRTGCIEAWCSGPGLAADHLRRTGADMDAAMIAACAEAGDMDCRETLNLHSARLGRALAGVVNVLDPDVIVLGGGLSNMTDLAGNLAEAVRTHVFSDSFTTPIRVNQLGDTAGVIGAAWLWQIEELAG